MRKHKKMLITLIILIIYIILKIYVINTPDNRDDCLPELILNLASDSQE